jgi:hypothetical protein
VQDGIEFGTIIGTPITIENQTPSQESDGMFYNRVEVQSS